MSRIKGLIKELNLMIKFGSIYIRKYDIFTIYLYLICTVEICIIEIY